MKKTVRASPKYSHFFVYLGLRMEGLGLQRKGAHAWVRLPITDARDCTTVRVTKDARVSLFPKPLQKGAAPGVIYLMEGDKLGANLFINSGSFQGRYIDLDEVARWQIQDAAARAEIRGQKAVKEELGKRYDLNRLLPFRLAYEKGNVVQRGMIIAGIVHYITSGQVSGLR